MNKNGQTKIIPSIIIVCGECVASATPAYDC